MCKSPLHGPCNYVDERGDDRPTVFYHYIETSETVLGVCFGKGNVSKKIQKPSCEYESKAWKADTEPKRARYCSAELLY